MVFTSPVSTHLAGLRERGVDRIRESADAQSQAFATMTGFLWLDDFSHGSASQKPL